MAFFVNIKELARNMSKFLILKLFDCLFLIIIFFLNSGVRENVGSKLTIKNKLLRGFLAELLGTFVFMSFSLGSVAQFIFREKASLLSSNISFGFGLTMGLVICGKVSGKNLFLLITYICVF